MSKLMNLKDRVKQFTNALPFMEGREKGELKELHGEKVTISEYGFMNGEDGDYLCFTVKENKENFYFGSSVMTENMKQLHDEGYEEEILKHGLPILLNEKMSKNKRKYTTVQFFPED